MHAAPPSTESHSHVFDAALIRVPVLALLFTAAAVLEAGRLTSLSSLSAADIWWHLRTGTWILQNHAFPHSGLFSQSAQVGWISPSWLFDLKVAIWYRWLGLRAIPILLMGSKVALAVVTFLLAGGLRGKFWFAAALSAVAQCVLGALQTSPTYGSILFLAVELVWLNESRRGNIRFLYWLPALFLIWANVDMQFIYGLAALLFFVAASVWQDRALSASRAAVVLGASAIVTLITPYSYHLYYVFFSDLTSAANQNFPNFHAMGFHQPQDYVLLLLTMSAFLALGLRRSRDAFQIALLIGCALLSFYERRETWLVVLASVCVLGDACAKPRSEERPRARHVLVAAALSIIVFVVASARISRDPQALVAKAGQSYPVAACNYIRDRGLPQPLFNTYEWGGFLTWYLPDYPVAIDTRPALYAEDFVTQYYQVMNANVPFTAYSAMTEARTLLLPRDSLMGEALSGLPRFKVAYSDAVAVVLESQD